MRASEVEFVWAMVDGAPTYLMVHLGREEIIASQPAGWGECVHPADEWVWGYVRDPDQRDRGSFDRPRVLRQWRRGCSQCGALIGPAEGWFRTYGEAVASGDAPPTAA